jgi:hypothetical protein
VIRPVLPLPPAAFSEVEGEGGESTAELSGEVAIGFLEAGKGGAEGADGVEAEFEGDELRDPVT